MNEIRELVEAFDAAVAAGDRCAIATIVSVEGSSYRRPGARMLICQSGAAAGNISAGCLENDLIERAKPVIQCGRAELVVYDTTSTNEDVAWGLGLGCNGVIQVLLEPVAASSPYINALRFARKRPVAIGTVYEGQAAASLGGRLIVTEDSLVFSDGLDTRSEEVLTSQLSRVIAGELPSGPASLAVDGSPVSVFMELIEPPIPLIIFGASHDALPLLEFANKLGWQTTIVDPLARTATAERFASAHKVVLARPEEISSQVEVTSRTFTVLMSHNYSHDVSLLSFLLSTPARYIGVMGPRRRTDRMLNEIRSGIEDLLVNPCNLDRLHSPVGLDIGANGPAEVALSIIAEMRAVLAGRDGGYLREVSGSIHGRMADGEQLNLTDSNSDSLVA